VAIQFLQVEKFVSDLSGVIKHKKKRILGKYSHSHCHEKSLHGTLETYLFSVSGARVQNRSLISVQNPVSSLNILVETGIPLMDSDNPQYIG